MDRYVYVGWPQCQELEEEPYFDEYSVPDPKDGGYFVDVCWLEEIVTD